MKSVTPTNGGDPTDFMKTVVVAPFNFNGVSTEAYDLENGITRQLFVSLATSNSYAYNMLCLI